MKLNMTIEVVTGSVDDDAAIDPTRVDPHDVAEGIVYEYNEWARANGSNPISFVAAEWAS